MLPLIVLMIAGAGIPLWMAVPLHLAVFTSAALVCHGRLAADRPAPIHLTEFYFWLAFGGMLGGVFNTLAAPVLFNRVIEYPLVLVLALAARRSHRLAAGSSWSLNDFARADRRRRAQRRLHRLVAPGARQRPIVRLGPGPARHPRVHAETRTNAICRKHRGDARRGCARSGCARAGALRQPHVLRRLSRHDGPDESISHAVPRDDPARHAGGRSGETG